MFEHHTVEQNQPEWFQLRAGKITMSELHKIMANYGKVFGPPAKQYAVNIAIEQITGKPVPSSFSNPHMDRGHEQEPKAKVLYESEKFVTVEPGGFYCSDSIGYSPDGLIPSEKGAIEIKSVISSIHYDNIRRQAVDPTKKWQCIGGMKFAGLDWIDFISYCEDFPEGNQLFVCRMFPDDFADEFEMIDKRVREFQVLIAETKKTIETSNYFL